MSGYGYIGKLALRRRRLKKFLVTKKSIEIESVGFTIIEFKIVYTLRYKEHSDI